MLTPSGDTPIEEICESDLVLASDIANPVESAQEFVIATHSRTSSLCNRFKRLLQTAMVPATLLTACDLAELPNDTASVEIYDARTGDWSQGVGGDLEAGDTFVESGRVLHVTEGGVEVRGEATTTLAEADATWVAEAAHRLPSGEDWVLVLGDRDDAGHWLLSEVEAGERFAFQGRVFDTADEDADGDLEVWATAAVVAAVQRTHVRDSKVLIDLMVSEGGSSELITGTPEHPFWVEALGDYVPLGELELGTVLHVDRGAGAVLVGMTWRQGDFAAERSDVGESPERSGGVFNFEVAGVHNYFVQEANGDDGVLVHNNPKCFQKGPGVKEPTPAPSGPSSRGKNKLKPDPNAAGPHSTFKTDADGNVTGHAEWQPNPQNPRGFDQAKRVDTQHANPHSHGNVGTPHTHLPKGGIRPSTPDELPE